MSRTFKISKRQHWVLPRMATTGNVAKLLNAKVTDWLCLMKSPCSHIICQTISAWGKQEKDRTNTALQTHPSFRLKHVWRLFQNLPWSSHCPQLLYIGYSMAYLWGMMSLPTVELSHFACPMSQSTQTAKINVTCDRSAAGNGEDIEWFVFISLQPAQFGSGNREMFSRTMRVFGSQLWYPTRVLSHHGPQHSTSKHTSLPTLACWDPLIKSQEHIRTAFIYLCSQLQYGCLPWQNMNKTLSCNRLGDLQMTYLLTLVDAWAP